MKRQYAEGDHVRINRLGAQAYADLNDDNDLYMEGAEGIVGMVDSSGDLLVHVARDDGTWLSPECVDPIDDPTPLLDRVEKAQARDSVKTWKSVDAKFTFPMFDFDIFEAMQRIDDRLRGIDSIVWRTPGYRKVRFVDGSTRIESLARRVNVAYGAGNRCKRRRGLVPVWTRDGEIRWVDGEMKASEVYRV